MMARIVATSDLHGQLPKIPECDLLLICGDICPDGSSVAQARWLDTILRPWLNNAPATEIVVVAGNHDFIFEQPHLIPAGLPWHYLQDDLIELLGFKIYGTPWQLPFWGAFNLDEKGLVMRYSHVPKNVDIFISHGPPYGIKDEVPSHRLLKKTIRHTGSFALRDKVLEIKPKLFVCGHIHCAFGTLQLENTIFANVSLLNNEMEMVNSPVLFEI